MGAITLSELAETIGKPIRSEEIKDLLETIGIKYPKKDTITNRAGERSFWLVGKKPGIELLFGVEVYNDKYKVEQAERKGAYVPILTNVHFQNNAKNDYPHNVSFGSTYEELKEKFGEPILNEYLARQRSWRIPYEQDIEFQIFYHLDNEISKVCEIWLSIIEDNPLITLYDPLSYETILYILGLDIKASMPRLEQNSLLSYATFKKQNIFFIYWAVKNGFLKLEAADTDTAKLKAGEIGVAEFIARYFADKSYVSKRDFLGVDWDFLHKYINNMPPYYISYRNDFEGVFLKDKDINDHDDELRELHKIEYSFENLKIVADIIDRRLSEYREHKFAKSAKAL
ncbi:MAG: hypothetical protein LBQ52_03690 [Helicobacteraceae bacterium]|jgi:hypothetical protein|nr:hypothetical protein [Helicobacteraceae bacterium]